MDNDRWSCCGINQFLCIIILLETLLQKKKNKTIRIGEQKIVKTKNIAAIKRLKRLK
jgi:hypothetical protein